MNFTALSSTGFWLGALAIAGALFALQRLRVRHREVVVVTTMFWRDALEQTRARTLVERFRHPLVYLFLLALGVTAWLGVAAPRVDRDDGAEHLFLLDLSAPMAIGERFEEAQRALANEVAHADRNHRRVVACGARFETLLAPGEDELLLGERLALVEPQACAPSVEAALLLFTNATTSDRPQRVHVVGSAPVRSDVLAALGDDVEVERIGAPVAVPTFERSPAIVGIACAPTPGRPGEIDVWVEMSGASGTVALAGELRGGAARKIVTPTRVEGLGGERARAVFEGLAADGSVFEARLASETAAPLAHSAVLVLPDLSPLRVAVGVGLPEPLHLALASHPAIEIVESGAEVAVRRVGDPTGGDLPALELSDADTSAAFVLVHPPTEDARSLLFDALGDLGLEWIDAGALADATGRTIELTERDGPHRRLELWSEIVAGDSPFTADSAFPLFVGRALEWLAGRAPARFAPRVGELVDARAAFAEDGSTLALEPAGADFVPPRAGLYHRISDAPVDALHAWPVLASAGPAYVPGADGLAELRAARVAPSSAFDLTNLVLLALVALLVVEWVLVRRGRMP